MRGRVDVVLDSSYGSSGKGKLSAWLADHFGYASVSSANYPNAGHTALSNSGYKFVAKALPTAAVLHRLDAGQRDLTLYVTSGSGFSWQQLCKEWLETERPRVVIHDRAVVVNESHAAREREGAESTAHIASTMQGSAVALCEKVLRKEKNPLVRHCGTYAVALENFTGSDVARFVESVEIVSAQEFRDRIHTAIEHRNLLHEGSQGYALSIDHGSHYPQCTSRNCTTAAALDYLGVAPQRLGDVWLNLRTFPIRVGSIANGYSGDVYSDSKEVTWEEVARFAGMPVGEAQALAERERTTVTKRIRRVFTFSRQNLVDAARTNGATKLSLNFAQYLNWADKGVTKFDDLSSTTRAFIDEIENDTGLPVALVGTGAKHHEMVAREEYL